MRHKQKPHTIPMRVDNVAAASPALTQNKGRGSVQDRGGCGGLQLGHKATALVPGAPSSAPFVGCTKYPPPPSQPCHFPSCSYKTCFTEGINKTNTNHYPARSPAVGWNRITSGLSLLVLSWGMRVSAPHPGVPRRAQTSAPIATPGSSRPEPASPRALAARAAPEAVDPSGVPAGTRCHTDEPLGAAVDRASLQREGAAGSALPERRTARPDGRAEPRPPPCPGGPGWPGHPARPGRDPRPPPSPAGPGPPPPPPAAGPPAPLPARGANRGRGSAACAEREPRTGPRWPGPTHRRRRRAGGPGPGRAGPGRLRRAAGRERCRETWRARAPSASPGEGPGRGGRDGGDARPGTGPGVWE